MGDFMVVDEDGDTVDSKGRTNTGEAIEGFDTATDARIVALDYAKAHPTLKVTVYKRVATYCAEELPRQFEIIVDEAKEEN